LAIATMTSIRVTLPPGLNVPSLYPRMKQPLATWLIAFLAQP
jgi:hypothetical protein